MYNSCFSDVEIVELLEANDPVGNNDIGQRCPWEQLRSFARSMRVDEVNGSTGIGAVARLSTNRVLLHYEHGLLLSKKFIDKIS